MLRLAPGFLTHPSAARVLLAIRVLLCRRRQLPFCCPRPDLERSRVAARVLLRRLRRPPWLPVPALEPTVAFLACGRRFTPTRR